MCWEGDWGNNSGYTTATHPHPLHHNYPEPNPTTPNYRGREGGGLLYLPPTTRHGEMRVGHTGWKRAHHWLTPGAGYRGFGDI